MTFVPSSSVRRAARLAAAAVALVALVLAARLPALAAPSTPDTPTVSASLEASSDAVPVNGTFGYTAHVRLDQPASYLQARLQVHRTSGQLVYQRTQIENDVSAGTEDFSFERQVSVLSLKPGAYPAELTVRATVDGSTETTTVAVNLLVYDPSKHPVDVVLVARVNAQPMFDSRGRLLVDPAVDTKARDDVDRIATLVTADPFSSVTLGVPPVVLAQWRRIASGYTSVDGTTVPSSDPTPQAYASALTHLQAAIATQRLELVTQGYVDPNLSDLVAGGVGDDTAAQYDAGISADFASLETTASTGTVPAGGCIPPSVLSALAGHGVGYVVTSGDCVRQGKTVAAPGAYPIAGTRLNALVSDVAASRSLQASETSTTVRHAFDRLGTSRAAQPLVVTVDLGQNRPDATSTVVAATNRLETLSWIGLGLGRDATVPKGTREVTTVADKPSSHTPPTFWRTVRDARRNARALISALGPGDPDAAAAQSDSLLAEASAWSEPSGTWALAPRGTAFATTAIQRAKGIFSKLKITVEPVTLSGAKGEVPVTIVNGTQKTLSMTIVVKPSGGIRVDTPRIPTVLRPRENFVQIPVDTQAALGGKIEVQLVAGNLVVARRTAVVRASYLDRLALLGTVFLVLVGLLVFIWRRVRRADIAETGSATSQADAPEDAERYTGTQENSSKRADTQ